MIKFIKHVLGYFCTPLFHLHHLVVLLVFHPIQVLSLRFGGELARKKSVIALNWFFINGLRIMGARVKFKGFDEVPTGRPIIIVANHQSIYDIPAVVWGFRKHYPHFISKIELSRNIPTISFDLRESGSALIDRSNGSQSVKEIFRLGRLIEKEKGAACIYPEGTRSADGKVKPFLPAGILTLLRAAPSAIVIPMAIEGHHRLQPVGFFPLSFGERLTYTALTPIDPRQHEPQEVVDLAEHAIRNALHQL